MLIDNDQKCIWNFEKKHKNEHTTENLSFVCLKIFMLSLCLGKGWVE